ncbi:MAG: ABC transporter ATP-binding protein [Spirochaetia bacterium]
MSHKPVITAEDLGFTVSGNTILSGVDLAVQEGEFLGLIGPNGAGKTTLLRLLLGLYAPTRGGVKLAGKPIAKIKPRERAKLCAYLSQDVITSFPYPVIDIILMGRYPYRGRFSREQENDLETARRALSYVGMSHLENRYFNELSGGERQLVLFAKVLAQESRILILDEPTSNLDIRHQDQFFSMALELTGERKAVIAAVHNLDVASQYCSRLLLLSRGEVAAQGPPEAVLKPEILDAVYGTETAVSRNTATGSLVVNVIPAIKKRRQGTVHLIGGAGSAVNLTRELLRLGYTVTGGIAHQYDADAQLWSSLGIKHAAVDPFAPITPDDVSAGESLIRNADLTLLCQFPVGPGNTGNLDLAARAARCILVTGTPGQRERSFFTEQGESRFKELAGNCVSLEYRKLLEQLEKGTLIGKPE